MMGKMAMMLHRLSVGMFLLAALCSALRSDGVQHMSSGNRKVTILQDTGEAKNCGNVPFRFTWSPKDLKPEGQVTVKLDYTVPHDLNSGHVSADVYFKGDTEPFIGYSEKFTCDEVKKYIPCPMKKGFKINRSQVIPNLRALSSYPGDYTVRVEVRNEKKDLMFCATLNITVLEGY